MKYTALIFDLDGTIIDTEHVWKQANLALLEKKGISYDAAQVQMIHQSLHGVALPAACAWLKEQFLLDDPVHHLIAQKIDLAHQMYKTHVQFISGFETFHESTRTFNLPTGVATNAIQSTVELTNQILNLRRFFGEHIYTIDHVQRVAKPNPAVYLYAAEQLEVDPHNCIAIEDSPTGIAAAKAAGMWCVGINTACDRTQLKQADHIIEGYHELALQKLL